MHPHAHPTRSDNALLTRRRFLHFAPAAAGAVWLAGQGDGTAAARIAGPGADLRPSGGRGQRVIRLHIAGGSSVASIARWLDPRVGSPGGWLEIALIDACPQTDLPNHIVLGSRGPLDGRQHPSPWREESLTPVDQGIHCREQGDPVLFLSDPGVVISPPRSETLPAITVLKRQRYQQLRGSSASLPGTQGELVFRMQRAASEVVDIGRESAATLRAYGARPGGQSFANRCLLARRFAQRGVRCVQLFEADADADSTSRAIAALLADLHHLGLLSIVDLPHSGRA